MANVLYRPKIVHVLLSGHSGAGKSTLCANMLEDLCDRLFQSKASSGIKSDDLYFSLKVLEDRPSEGAETKSQYLDLSSTLRTGKGSAPAQLPRTTSKATCGFDLPESSITHLLADSPTTMGYIIQKAMGGRLSNETGANPLSSRGHLHVIIVSTGH